MMEDKEQKTPFEGRELRHEDFRAGNHITLQQLNGEATMLRRNVLPYLSPALRRLDASDPANHKAIVLVACFLTRLVTSVLIHLCTSWLRLPLFDSSPLLETDSALLRWDAFHFANIARNGGQQEWEHELAFGNGLPLIMTTLASLLGVITGQAVSNADLVWVGSWAAYAFGLFVPLELYMLTLDLTKKPNFALLSALLYCIPTSPPTTAFAPYTEPFFAFFAFHGMRNCLNNQSITAALNFALATTFRATAILLWGFLLWYNTLEPALKSLLQFMKMKPWRPLFLATMAAAVPIPAIFLTVGCVQVVLQQVADTQAFCTESRTRPWCPGPSVGHLFRSYAFVQDHYWNSGFLRYWAPAQIPNFLISAPVYALNLFYASAIIISGATAYYSGKGNTSFSKQLLPFALHGLGFTLILLFTAHVQIALRQVSSLPITFWGAASLLSGEFGETGRFFGKAWVVWSVMWGVISCALWSTFLPPA